MDQQEIVATRWGRYGDPNLPYYLDWMMKADEDEKEIAHVATDAFTKAFEHRVIEAFKPYNNTLTKNRTSTQLGHVKMLTLATAGRVMVTLRRGDEQVSFVYDDTTGSPPRMGLQSIECSFLEAIDIVKEACVAWEARVAKDPSVFVKVDDEVWFG